MFSSAIQPGLVSLFSSTGGEPLRLFSSHTDPTLPADSFICLLNDASSLPRPPPPAALMRSTHDPQHDSGAGPDYALQQTVLHIQSPTLPTTYIRCPPSVPARDARSTSSRGGDLGMKHPWVHVQVRNMGREWSFEVGLVDQSGREGIVRCSTFQKQPRLKLGSPPLLHLPLAFPPFSSHPLTSWCTIALHLPSLLPYFSSAALTHNQSEQDAQLDEETASSALNPRRDLVSSGHASVPSGTYSHVSYVKVYATCRLRRIWFSEGGPRQKLPWEFQLYSAD